MQSGTGVCRHGGFFGREEEGKEPIGTILGKVMRQAIQDFFHARMHREKAQKTGRNGEKAVPFISRTRQKHRPLPDGKAFLPDAGDSAVREKKFDFVLPYGTRRRFGHAGEETRAVKNADNLHRVW